MYVRSISIDHSIITESVRWLRSNVLLLRGVLVFTAIMKPGIRLVKLLWTAHFFAGFIVICLGVLSNGGGR